MKNQVEDSVSSVELTVASLAVSTSKTSSIFCSGIIVFELLIGSSVVGDLITGEFLCCCCCCSSSYSLIKRFLSG